jgi:hypothetical protein
MAAHDTAATWDCVFRRCQLWLSFLIFTLPAGALADNGGPQEAACSDEPLVNNRGGALALLGRLHLLSIYVILISVFPIGVGFAFAAPAWTSIVPEIVSPRASLCSNTWWIAQTETPLIHS